MAPVHDYPKGVAKTNCADPKEVDNNRPDEHREPSSRSPPPSTLQSGIDMALCILIGIATIVVSMVLHVILFYYTMRRFGLIL